MHMRAGLQRHLEDLEIGHRLGQRRARAAMHDRLDPTLRARLRREHLHQFLILVVDRDGSPVFAISRNAASIVGWSMRGNRTASYS